MEDQKKKRKPASKFQEIWLQQDGLKDWLERFPGDENRFNCSACHRANGYSGGKTNVEKHGKSEFHRKRFNKEGPIEQLNPATGKSAKKRIRLKRDPVLDEPLCKQWIRKCPWNSTYYECTICNAMFRGNRTEAFKHASGKKHTILAEKKGLLSANVFLNRNNKQKSKSAFPAAVSSAEDSSSSYDSFEHSNQDIDNLRPTLQPLNIDQLPFDFDVNTKFDDNITEKSVVAVSDKFKKQKAEIEFIIGSFFADHKIPYKAVEKLLPIIKRINFYPQYVVQRVRLGQTKLSYIVKNILNQRDRRIKNLQLKRIFKKRASKEQLR